MDELPGMWERADLIGGEADNANWHKSTVELQYGDEVVTSEPDGDDFGLPLVSPTTRQRRNRTVRIVKSVVRQNGGQVVRFTDGSKTRPMHGRTSWLLA